MSFSRKSYDDCAYKVNLQDNVGILSYNLDTVAHYRCEQCRPELGIVGGNNVSIIKGNLVDLESNLFGIDREASKCQTMKYLPRNDNKAVGAKYYHEGCVNEVDTRAQHLNGCQMFDTLSVPHTPSIGPFTCQKYN